MLPIIETQGLSKTYGDFGALHELDIAVPEGSVFALMGSSGAGKTTAIKILLNLLSATRGKAMICGVESRAIGPAVLSQVGYVSENQSLPARLRVGDFFAYLRPCYAEWDRVLEEECRLSWVHHTIRRMPVIRPGVSSCNRVLSRGDSQSGSRPQ
jgi:ABC-2 type transport system ATP-binding protein